MTADIVHVFSESAARSKKHTDAPWWPIVYRMAFPGFLSSVAITEDGPSQRAGIDRIITLRSGKHINVDEKVRERDYDDFCLEYWSDTDRRVLGWMAKELNVDYIAYAFVPSQRCYLLPFDTLRLAWRRNAHAWKNRYLKIRARNQGSWGEYITTSVAVPIPVVLDAIRDATLIEWGMIGEDT